MIYDINDGHVIKKNYKMHNYDKTWALRNE